MIKAIQIIDIGTNVTIKKNEFSDIQYKGNR